MKRFFATLIDLTICFGLFIAVAYLAQKFQFVLLGREVSHIYDIHDLPPEVAPQDAHSVVGLQNAMANASIITFLLVTWAYYTFRESSSAMATVGKRIVGLAVTDLNGRRISRVRATIRFIGRLPYLFLIAPAFVISIAMSGALGRFSAIALAIFISALCSLVPATRKFRRLHDWLSRTVVVERTRLSN